MLKELVLSLPLDSLWDLDHSTYSTLPLSYVHPYQQQQCKVNSFDCLLRLFDPPPPPFFLLAFVNTPCFQFDFFFFFLLYQVCSLVHLIVSFYTAKQAHPASGFPIRIHLWSWFSTIKVNEKGEDLQPHSVHSPKPSIEREQTLNPSNLNLKTIKGKSELILRVPDHTIYHHVQICSHKGLFQPS